MPALDRFLLVGDAHTEHQHLAKALEFARGETLDAVLCVGDVLDGEGDFAATVALLEECRAQCVRGNHERWFLEDRGLSLPDATPREQVTEPLRSWMSALPAQRFYSSPAGMVQLCHGLGAYDMGSLRPDDFGYGLASKDELWRLVRDGQQRVVLHGHTHRRMVRTLEGVTFVNAGTLRRGHSPCFALVDLGRAEARFYDLEPELRPAERFELPRS